MIKSIFSALLVLAFFAAGNAQLNMSLVGQFGYDFNTNDIWGYMAPNGDEYALVGTRPGFSIVDINVDPIVEVDFIPGSTSTWRDIKTWKDFAYVSTEAADGLLVVDLRSLPDSTTHFFWTPTFEGHGTLLTIHNIFIDENGILFVSGSNLNGGGVIMVDVDTNPGQPELIGFADSRYSHDAYARDSILYSSEINNGTLSIYDFHDVNNITLEGRVETPSSFTHNAWLSDDSKTIFTTDERSNGFVASYDINDFNDIIELDRYRPAATLGEGVVPHNVHVLNDYLLISYYVDGGIIVDASRPDNLIEVGNYDTYLNQDPGFGAWGLYPYLPSGKVLVTDSGNGLFVLAPTFVRGAYLEGSVKGRTIDEDGNEIIIDLLNAEITITSDEAVTPVMSNESGIFKTGKAVPGTFPVSISADGYLPWTGDVIFENGVVTELDVILEVGTATSVQNSHDIINAISVFPNPVVDQIRIDLRNLDMNVEQLTVTNILGQKILIQNIQNQNEIYSIDASDWANGSYFIQIKTEDQQQGVIKVVKD